MDRQPTLYLQRSYAHKRFTNLVTAVKALSPSLISLQTTRHLPFLPRTLRKGFLNRCRELLVPTYPLDKEIHLQVQYSIAGEVVHQAVDVDKWSCPICDFFGEFPTRETLECHLQWDHQEVYCEWKDLGLREDLGLRKFWRLELMVQESNMSPSSPLRSAVQEKTPETPTIPPDIKNSCTFLLGSLSLQTDVAIKREEEEVETFLMAPDSPVVPTEGLTDAGPDVDIQIEEVEVSLEVLQASATPTRTIPGTYDPPTPTHVPWPRTRPTTTRPTTRKRTLPPPPENPPRTRSTTRKTATTSQLTPPPPPPPPPPRENLLGPAAQPPYLPADYGGNLVLYSCRPGGPCLFDLLATLPMEPFGLLDWEVIDREDEIYERDDIKEEYKVINALWARWIILNRPKFIADYAQGVIAFVDEYWKMIHWAAGWEALRYLLLILLANKFLTGSQVAQTLTHYEGLTGMASWYD